MVHRRGPATMREVDLSGEDVIERLLLVVVHACPEGTLLRKRSGKPGRSCDDALCGQTARTTTCPILQATFLHGWVTLSIRLASNSQKTAQAPLRSMEVVLRYAGRSGA